MATDEALLDHADRTGVATLRLYSWSPPCLSFGRHEAALRRYNRELIERMGVDVVRRPTGGRAVWHEDEVTYAVAAPIAEFGSLSASYCAIHERLAAALRLLGLAPTLAPQASVPRLDSRGACFAAPVGGEVLIGGKKVVGSAQVRRGRAFLQHGSILLGGSQDTIRSVSREAVPPEGATTLSAALGRSVSFAEVAGAVVQTWDGGDGVAETSSPLPERLTAAYFDPGWTWRR